MAYEMRESKFPSADGKHECHVTLWLPEGEIRGVVQISHGMVEYVERYLYLAAALTQEGYVVAGNDHLGHGKTAASPEEYGYFAENNGRDLVVEDLHTMTKILREMFPGKPLILFGHSMGSFLARLYVTRYQDAVDAAIFCGTAGKNALAGFGIALAGMLSALRGDHHRSKIITRMAFGNYNRKFPKEDGESAWLTRDHDVIAVHDKDELSTFRFTDSAYRELFRLVKEVNRKAWYRDYPKTLPTFLIAGDMDPVGNYGEGPRQVYQKLWDAGVSPVDIKIYPDCRHELYSEFDREKIFADVISWIDGVIGTTDGGKTEGPSGNGTEETA